MRLRSLLFLTLAGCAQDDRIELEDVGRACIVPADAAYQLEQLPELSFDYGSDPLVLDAVIDECALSCAEDLDMGCDVTLEGDVLRIDVYASYVAPRDQCDASCRVLRVSCDVPELSPGTYSVQMGATNTTLVVPSSASAVCVEQYTG